MKPIYFIVLCTLLLSSCGSARKSTEISTVREERTDLTGEKVMAEAVKFQGIEMGQALSEDGTNLIDVPFKWYMGIGKADMKQVAVELAQREAYATVSRVISNLVKDNAERGNLANNGKVEQALTSYWEQMSTSIQRGCEPFGEVIIEYNESDRMYTAYAKVAIRGDKFNRLLSTGTNFAPEAMSEEERKSFIDTNKRIIDAAKGL